MPWGERRERGVCRSRRKKKVETENDGAQLVGWSQSKTWTGGVEMQTLTWAKSQRIQVTRRIKRKISQPSGDGPVWV